MNKFFINTLIAAGLLLSFPAAQARIFEILPTDTFHEIVEGRHGIIKYEVIYSAPQPSEITAEVSFIHGKEVIEGVEQICINTEEGAEHCVESCGALTVDLTAPGICKGTTELGDQHSISCELLLCVDADRITNRHREECKEGPDGDLKGCAPKICTDRDYVGSCDAPLQKNSLNIEKIPEGEGIHITLEKPGAHTRPPHTATMRPGVPYDFIIRNDSTHKTAHNIIPEFTDGIAALLEPYSVADCVAVAPLSSCTIELTAKSGASLPAPTPVFFAGTNTNEVEGFIRIERRHHDFDLVLRDGGITFFEPGIRELFVRNTTTETIRITDVDLRDVDGVTVLDTAIDPDDCEVRGGIWYVRPGRECGINFEADRDAYLPDQHPGRVLLTYHVDGGRRQVAQGTVVVEEIHAQINHGKPIRIPTDDDVVGVNDTNVIVEVKNLGNFTWQDIEFAIEPALPGVTFDASACPGYPLNIKLERDEFCNVIFTSLLDSEQTLTADSSFVASGINGHAEERIILNEISVVPSHERYQHLQYQSIDIINNTDGGEDATDLFLKDVRFSSNLAREVRWCHPRSPDCVYRSTCHVDRPIEPGRSCRVVIKSENTQENPLVIPGEVYLDIEDGDELKGLFTASFQLAKEVNLYATGAFTAANDTSLPVSNIAKWNGTTWSFLGFDASRQGLQGPGRGITDYRGDMIVVGDFVAAGGSVANTEKVAVWRGSHWSGLNGFPTGINGYVNAVTVETRADDTSVSKLIIGGSFNTVNGRDGRSHTAKRALNVAQWSEEFAWTALGEDNGNGTDGPVNAVANCGELLCVGGDFKLVDDEFGLRARHIAGWNQAESEWHVFGGFFFRNGTNHAVDSIHGDSADFAIAGAFTRASSGISRIRAYHVAKWNSVERRWHHVASRDGDRVINNTVRDITVHNGTYFIGGDFNNSSLRFVAMQNGLLWKQVDSGINGPVHNLTSHGEYLYAGGSFSGTFPTTLNNVSRWNGGSWEVISGGVTGGANPQVNAVHVTHSIHLGH
ncbi:MAG: hypothetical protein ACHP9Y_00160 [Gammaproteobacteria bacterium]